MPGKPAPKLRMSDGYEIPTLGLGTWRGNSITGFEEDSKAAKLGEVERAVRDAIDAGYRHIDTAFLYESEDEVGAAVRAKIAEGVVTRQDLFITTKLWNNFHRPDMVEDACRLSLSELGLDYVDLYLMHWPVAYKDGYDLAPMDTNGKIQFSDVNIVDTYRAMEKLVEKKLVRSIGVSNFNSKQLKRILDNAVVKPVVNQIECHPYLNQKKLMSFCQENNILVVAYSPFGSPDRPWGDSTEKRLLDDAVIIAMAKKHNKSAGQVVLRYLIQRNAIPIPKSVTKSRINENIDVFDFTLTNNDMEAIDAINKNRRSCPLNESIGHPEYPFHIEFEDKRKRK